MVPHLPRLGLYDKAIPAALEWPARLHFAKQLGFDFVEMSIDESDGRLARLDWSKLERRAFRDTVAESGMQVPSICLSAHRRFPFGSADPEIRRKAHEVMDKAIDLAVDIGVRTIQLAGYDVYYEPQTEQTRAWFAEGLLAAAGRAAAKQVMLGVEIMDTPLMGTISNWLSFKASIPTPWFQVYPDVGNLSAWSDTVAAELALGLPHIVALHLKDTLRPKEGFAGQFRDLPFGAGCVDFAQVFATLKALNYQGAFVIEMWSEKAADPAKEILTAKDYLIAQMRKGQFIHD